MESLTKVQILDEAVFVSLRANVFEKDMNQPDLYEIMGRIAKQTGFFSLG